MKDVAGAFACGMNRTKVSSLSDVKCEKVKRDLISFKQYTYCTGIYIDDNGLLQRLCDRDFSSPDCTLCDTTLDLSGRKATMPNGANRNGVASM